METLESSKLFSHLPAGELGFFRQALREMKVPAGEQIFKEGDDGDGMYVVKDGLIEISGIMDQNVRKVFAQIGPGDFFGEMAIVENKPRSASAIAAEASTVYFLPRTAMLEGMQKSPLLAMELVKEISSRLREFNRRYIEEILQTEKLTVLGRFARAIVHDLKNPLNIIGLTAEMAGMESASVEMRQKTKGRILKQVERINDLIGEILEFTQSAHATFALSPANFAEYVRHFLDEIQGEMEIKDIQIELRNQPPPVTVRLDAKRLRRVFQNLINNASDFMPDAGKIFVRFYQDGSEIVTELEDTGRGIAPQIADKLFQAFATFGKAHGTGLGLSICKKIVEDHGGRIWARNEPGRGAIFCFSLPLAN